MISDKTVMNLDHRDQTLWLIYIIISNLNIKIWQIQTCLSNLLFDSILIIYKHAKDLKNKDKNLKAKIYYLALKTMLEYIILVFSLYIIILLIVLALIEYYNEGIKILYINNFKQYYYLIFIRVMVDYKE